MSRISLRTTFVLDATLEQATYRTPKIYRGGRAYTLRTGAGLAQSLRSWAPATFVSPKFAPTIEAATAPKDGVAAPELVVVPRLWSVAIDDDGQAAKATVVVRVLLTAVTGAAIDTFEVSAEGAANTRPGDDPDRERLRAAVSAAYTRALIEIGDGLNVHPALRLITAGKVRELVHAYTVRYQAALECATQQGASTTEVDSRFGLEYPAVRTRIRVYQQKAEDGDRLAVVLIGCNDDRRAPSVLLTERLREVRALADAGRIDAANQLLTPLEALAPSEEPIKAERRYLSKLERAAEAARAAEEARERAAQEARDKAEREAREAVERERRLAAAQPHVIEARKHVAAKRFDRARIEVDKALAIYHQFDNTPELDEVLALIDAHDQQAQDMAEAANMARQERERKSAEAKRQAEIRRVMASAPTMLRQCATARDAFGRAQEIQRQAAVGGNPSRAEAAQKAMERAQANYFEAQQTLRRAIQLYRDAGMGPAASGLEQEARRQRCL